jgi:predicted ATP-grasp superfamily ATP-dependent carboligase
MASSSSPPRRSRKTRADRSPSAGCQALYSHRNESYDVLILGVSARAAAFTAMRCGLRPRCVDAFADRDLAAVCPVERVDWKDAAPGFLTVSESLPPSPWFYTGGFENDPELVEGISRRHQLWGVGAEVLRAIRDPIAVARILTQVGIPLPEVQRDPTGLPTDGSWLVKPIASGGGRGIERLTDRSIPRSSPCYFQRFVDGPSFSAAFIAQAGEARLIGITRQWVGIAGSAFAYRGSIGPYPIAAGLAGSLVRGRLYPVRRGPVACRDQPSLYGLDRNPRAGH